jgi:hypothetical protein
MFSFISWPDSAINDLKALSLLASKHKVSHTLGWMLPHKGYTLNCPSSYFHDFSFDFWTTKIYARGYSTLAHLARSELLS